MSVHRNVQKLLTLSRTLQAEILFAWGTLLVSISVATGIFAILLALGTPALVGILAAVTPMSILTAGLFFVRQARQRRQARRTALSPYVEIEDLLRSLNRISSDDRESVICRVLDQCNARPDGRVDEQERRIRRFGLYLLGGGVFSVTAMNIYHHILEHTPIDPLLDIALIISAGVVAEMLLCAIQSLRMHTAELKLKRLLGLA